MTTPRAAFNPHENTVRAAIVLPNWFGAQEDGVQFDPDGPVFREADTEIPLDQVFVSMFGD